MGPLCCSCCGVLASPVVGAAAAAAAAADDDSEGISSALLLALRSRLRACRADEEAMDLTDAPPPEAASLLMPLAER